MVDTVTNGTGAAGVGAANSKLECVVEYDYDAQLGDELTIRVGDVITDIDMMEGGWWKGNLRGKIGMFPDNFVKLLPSPPKGSAENGDATAKKCHVLFSYSPAHDDELSLDVGDVVEYMGDVEEGWYKGRLNGRVGVFPSNFVEICNTNCDNNKNNSHHRPQNIVETSMNQDSKQMFSDTTTKNQYNSESNKQSGARNKSLNGGGDVANISPDVTLNSAKNDGGNSPSSPNSRGPGVAGMMTTSERMLRNTDPAPGAAPRLPPKPVKDQCVVLFPYTAQNQDELTLVEGEIITIVSRVIEDAGWWRGELDGKVGVFPDNFVKVISSECGESTPNSSAGGTPTSSVINSKVNSLVSGSNKQLFDKKTSSSRDNITDHVSSVLSEADKKKDSPDKLNSSSPLSSSGGSRLSRTSSERGSGSSSQTSARMQSMGLNNKQVSASGSNDSFKSQSSSNVSEKKALFSGRSGSSANLKENEIRSNEPRSDSRIKNNYKTDDRIIKKPVLPEALTKTLSSTNSQEPGENTKSSRSTEIENGTVVLRNPPTTTTGMDQVNREQTLSNLTASRVKAPKRRPPSNVFLKENIPDELDNEVENETNNDDSQHKQSKEESFKKSSDNIEKQFNPLKMGISVLPGKESLRSTGTFDNTTKNREETANQEKSKVEANPVKNMWLEELSRKQANRRSMTALNERKQDHLGIPAKTESSPIPSGSKPAIPSKPLDTRKSLSSIIRRPNSFGEKTAANTTSSTSAINQSGSGKVEAKLGETKSSVALFAAKTNSSSSDGAKNSTGSSRQDLTRKISGGGERNRKDSLSKESSFEHRSLSPKRSLGDDRSSLLSSSKIKDSSPRSGSKESGKEQTQRISNKENKDVNHHRSSSKESERSRRSTASELIRKASDSMNKLNTDNSKPAVHSNNLGKPGSWSFAERPERPTDLSKLDFLNRSPKLDSSSSKGDLSRLESSQKSTSNNNISASLDTHEEAGFVVVEATNEILKSTAASLWASEDGGEQPRPPAREKNQSGGIGTQLSSAAKSQEPAGIVKALEKRVEELERLIIRVETNYKSDVASLTGQLESERQRRLHLEQEISKLNRIVNNK